MTLPTQFTGKAINREGEALLDSKLLELEPQKYEESMAALSYWRATHEMPLEEAYALLGACAEKISVKVVLAKRLKRAPSIISKLRRFDGMKLRNMQDIGGCRAILPTHKKLLKLLREFKRRKTVRIKDYIETPKPDGYRGIHLIGDFSDKTEHKRSIEIQLRTEIQHAWATGVEIVDLFTGQAIKSNRGKEEWKEFFRSLSVMFSLIEGLNLTKPKDMRHLVDSIVGKLVGPEKVYFVQSAERAYTLSSKLKVIENLEVFAATLKVTDEHLTMEPHDGYVLLSIHVKNKALSLLNFAKSEFALAVSNYLEYEKMAASDGQQAVVLLAAEAVGGIKEAYPNYFGDSSRFLTLLRASNAAYRQIEPNRLWRTIKRMWV